jgi:hypothetical protein
MATCGLTFIAPKKTNSIQRPGFGRILAGFAPVLALYILYTAVRWLVAGRGPRVGTEHALSLLRLESSLHLDWEYRLQQATLGHTWLVHLANYYYVFGFLPVLILCTVLGAWRAPTAFAWWRTVFAISLLLALVGFAIFPLTPPRLLPSQYGYLDTLLAYGPHYYGDSSGSSFFNAYGSIPSVVNVYAAMPSMHIAWSIIAGALLCAAFGMRRWTIPLAVLHPVLMAYVVIVSGNHYVLDVVFGIIVLVTSIFLARAWHQVRVRREVVSRVEPVPA